MLKNKGLIGILFIFIFSLSFISASIYDDCEIYGNCEPISEGIVTGANYSINVNNSNYLQGYTPTTLGTWLNTTFGWITEDIGTLVNYFTKTEIESNYVPYTGANQNVDLGDNNLTVNGTTLFVDSDNGRVGIGTANPLQKLHTNGSILANGSGFFEGNVGIGLTTPQNKLDVEGAAVIGSTYAGINTAPTDGLLVEGNVGINTTSPQNSLNVVGDVNFTRNLIVDTSTLFVDSVNNWVGIGDATPQAPLQIYSTQDGILRLQQSGGGWNYIEYWNSSARTAYFGTDDDGNFEFSIPGGVVQIPGSYFEAKRVSAGGSPSSYSVLDVNGNLQIHNLVGSSTNAVLGYIRFQSLNNRAEPASFAQIEARTDPTTWYKGTLLFRTNGVDGTSTGNTPAERMRITSIGRVGIGTTAPFELLHVSGNILANGTINATGSMKVGGDLNVTGNITGNQIYGEAWYHNHTATELNFAVDGLYYNLTFDNSLVNGMNFNDAGDYLEIVIDGVYQINYMASGDGQNNHAYFTSITINGVVQDKCESHKKMTAGGDVVTMTGSCLLSLNIDDQVKLATADIGGTGTGNYYSSNINLVRIGN